LRCNGQFSAGSSSGHDAVVATGCRDESLQLGRGQALPQRVLRHDRGKSVNELPEPLDLQGQHEPRSRRGVLRVAASWEPSEGPSTRTCVEGLAVLQLNAGTQLEASPQGPRKRGQVCLPAAACACERRGSRELYVASYASIRCTARRGYWRTAFRTLAK